MIRALTSQFKLFDYATQYYYTHDTITGPREFRLTELEYEAYLSWLKSEDFSYQTEAERRLTYKNEGAYVLEFSEDVSDAITSLVVAIQFQMPKQVFWLKTAMV